MVIPEAGAVVFKRQNSQIKFLVLRSKKDPSRWIFPKGHIEPGETSQQAATRELMEEAGVLGESVASLGMVEFFYRGDNLQVEYYLHTFLDTRGTGEKGREPGWYTYEDAIKILSFKDSIKLLQKAIEIINNSPDLKQILSNN